MEQTNQRTEKLLFGALSVFLLILAFNFFTGSARPTETASADDGEQSDEASAPSSDDEESQDDEDSVDDENSVDDVSVKPASRTTTVPVKTDEDSVDDLSVKSVDEVSVKTEGETSVKSVDTEPSDSTTEVSEKSAVIGDANATTKTKTEKVMVKRSEKLFFLVPVEVESEVLVDGDGTVIAERKNFINWLKSIFSL